MAPWDHISLLPEIERIAAQADPRGALPPGGHAGHTAHTPAPPAVATALDDVRLSGGAQILQWFVSGRTIPEIATSLGLPAKQVEAALAEAVAQAVPAASIARANSEPIAPGPGIAPPLVIAPAEIPQSAPPRPQSRQRKTDPSERGSPWYWVERDTESEAETQDEEAEHPTYSATA
jgi:hypothetical protein